MGPLSRRARSPRGGGGGDVALRESRSTGFVAAAVAASAWRRREASPEPWLVDEGHFSRSLGASRQGDFGSTGRSWRSASSSHLSMKEDSFKELSKAFAGPDKAVAVLAPADGWAPAWKGPMVPPALVRGSMRELRPPSRPERSLWPHGEGVVRLTEVSLSYPAASAAPPGNDPLRSGAVASSGELFGGALRSEALAPRTSADTGLVVPPLSSLAPLSPPPSPWPPAPSSEEASPSSRLLRTAGSSRQSSSSRLRGGPLGGPLGASSGGGWLFGGSSAGEESLQQVLSIDELATESTTSVRRCRSDVALGALPPVTGEAEGSSGRARSPSAVLMLRSLGATGSHMLTSDLARTLEEAPVEWLMRLVSKPPLREPPSPRPPPARPARTPAFLKAQKRSLLPLAGLHKTRGALQKSEEMQQRLFIMRRGGPSSFAEVQEPEEKITRFAGCSCCSVPGSVHSCKPCVPKKAQLDQEVHTGSIMDRIVQEKTDSIQTLTVGVDCLKNSHALLGVIGGRRHPTNLAGKTTLGVVERKLEVLKPLQEAIEAMEAIINRKAEIVEAVLNGMEAHEAAGAAVGIEDIMQEAIHEGNLVEDAKGMPVEKFLKMFKLPADHALVLMAQALMKEHAAQWIALCHGSAKKEIDRERAELLAMNDKGKAELEKTHLSRAGGIAMRLTELAGGLGVEAGHPLLKQTEQTAIALRAAALMRYSRTEARKDVEATDVQGDIAAFLASQIEFAVKAAMDFGCGDDHPDIKSCMNLARDLRASRVLRYAKDQTRQIQPVLGSAGQCSDDLEEALREALEVYGVSKDHPLVAESRALALAAREQENMLKRKENRAGKRPTAVDTKQGGSLYSAP
ncbi:unnamed protein product [Polarella glacialis]|uniref:Uncharacterized protein n=2 Tax=Polarella glacialis TaxID=89957 RepID=A0A813I887_POLGL|nr:unnamed protein product [Polarella glacialis]